MSSKATVIAACLLACVAFGSPARAGAPSAIETTLANGLQVLVVPIHAAPVVSVGVLYKTGSRNETPWTTGVAHQVEHMLFKGTTDWLKPGDIDRLFIDNNASTGSDSTYYYETFQSGELESALHVEADRMLNAAFDPAQLAHENVVVLSELEGDANAAQSLLDEHVEATAFEANQYHWPVIGWKPVVQTFATRRDLVYDYYWRHYAPENAVLVVAGDVDASAALALIHKYFDAVVARPIAPFERVQEPPQHGVRIVTVAGAGGTNWIELGYKVPGQFDADSYPLAVLDALLAKGQSSRLYQALVQGGLSSDLFSATNPNVDPYLYTIAAPLEPGIAFGKVRRAIEREVTRSASGSIGAAELAKAKKQVIAGYVFAHDGIESLANFLATWQAFTGDWREDARYAGRISAVTPEQVRAVASKYLRENALTIGEFHATKNNIAARVYSRSSGRLTPPAEAVDDGRLKTAADPVRVVLPNGLVLIVQEDHANADVAIAVAVDAGSAFDPMREPGLASVTQEMLLRGTTAQPYEKFQAAIDALGIDIVKSLDHSRAAFDTESLTDDEPKTMRLVADMLQHPALTSTDFHAAVEQLQGDLRVAKDDPDVVASNALWSALYSPTNAWSRPVGGTLAGISAVKIKQVRAFYRTHYAPDDTAIVVTGDVTASIVRDQVERLFGAWRPSGAPRPGPFVPPPARATQLAVVNPMPGKSQVQVAIGAPGVAVSSSDFAAAQLMNFILGGPSFTARYLHEIRDVEGLVYGVGSRFVEEAGGAGPWEVSFGANPRNVRRAIGDVADLARQLQRDGVTDDELAQARRLAVDDLVTREQTNSGIADELLRDEQLGLGLDYARRLPAIYANVTAPQIKAAAQKYLNPNGLVISISGPYR